MNYTLKDLNQYIETEKRNSNMPREHFTTIAIIDFCHTPQEEFLAEIEICKYVKVNHNTSVNVASYNELQRLFENGLLNIVQLTSRQKLMFLTCLSDSACVRRMVIAAAENEGMFCKLRKALPIVVSVLRDSDLYGSEQVKAAQTIANWFMDCNQKVLNYRRYIYFVRQVL